MVEKIDQKKCRDISTEIQEILAKWGKYFFYYYPKEHRIRPSEFAARHMGIVENAADLEHSILMDRIMEKEKLLKLFQDIDHGAKTVSAKIQSSGKDMVYQISMGGIQGGSQKQPEYVLGLIEQIRADTRQNEIIQALGSNFNSVYYVDVDHDKVYVYKVNSAVRSVLNDTLKEIPGYEAIMAEYVGKVVLTEDRETMLYETSIENLRKQLSLKKAYQYDYRIVRDGKVKYCRAKFVNTSDGGQLHRMVAGFSDISSEKQRELERMAYVDSVTGGNNYESFKKKIRDFRQPGYLVSMDIHSFKIINSICGIIKGDETLKGIWKCIQGILEKDDLAGHINADRFVIYSSGKDQEKTIRQLQQLETILAELSERLKVPKLIPYFGVTKWKPDSKVEEVYSEANFAKNQIKDRKDISYQFYSHEDTIRMLEDKAMEDEFKHSLENNCFEVWYQPKYDPETERMVGAEGLIRWRDEEGNVIPPGKFIPLFERDGLIKVLDEYVFRKVCMQQLEWQKQGKEIIPVSINLSRASLYFDSVVSRYQQIADEIGVKTHLVPIEITESAAIDNDNIKGLADKFHDNGFPLLVDDFGSGYSSLATLNMKCFDTLKIDKSLIDYIGDFSGERLLEHTILLAKELGLCVTAEGVEREEQVDFLKQMKCDSIQGYYYSRPLPKEEFEKLLLTA